eukprot:tig00000057_g68.t1
MCRGSDFASAAFVFRSCDSASTSASSSGLPDVPTTAFLCGQPPASASGPSQASKHAAGAFSPPHGQPQPNWPPLNKNSNSQASPRPPPAASEQRLPPPPLTKSATVHVAAGGPVRARATTDVAAAAIPPATSVSRPASAGSLGRAPAPAALAARRRRPVHLVAVPSAASTPLLCVPSSCGCVARASGAGARRRSLSAPPAPEHSASAGARPSASCPPSSSSSSSGPSTAPSKPSAVVAAAAAAAPAAGARPRAATTCELPLSRSAPASCSRLACTCSLRILVADDEPLNRALARRAFGHLCPNARVDAVQDGRAAVEAFCQAEREGGYDAAVLDFEMPRLNGAEAAEEIRRGEAGAGGRAGGRPGSRTRLVAWTSLVAAPPAAASPTVDRCTAAGFDQVLPKPCPAATVVNGALASLQHAPLCPFLASLSLGPAPAACCETPTPRAA